MSPRWPLALLTPLGRLAKLAKPCVAQMLGRRKVWHAMKITLNRNGGLAGVRADRTRRARTSGKTLAGYNYSRGSFGASVRWVAGYSTAGSGGGSGFSTGLRWGGSDSSRR